MAADGGFRDDLYEILGLEAGADEKEVARAYKKKSIVHHPDRGGDVKKFLELTHARDVLLDPKEKEAYDKKLSRELMAKKQQRERDAELDAKRRQMRDELLRKETAASLPRKTSSRRDKSDLSKLREKGVARQKELEERLARDARRQRDLDQPRRVVESKSAGKAQRTVTLRWDRRQFSHSDETLSRALRSYGDIEAIKLKASSAKVVFADTSAAAKTVRVEGHKPCWREVSLQGHLVETDDAFAFADVPPAPRSAEAPTLPAGPISLAELREFEQRVLEKLRSRVAQQRAGPSPVSAP